MAISVEPALKTSAPDEYTRLHITPLDPNLLRTVLPSSIFPNARNISYHTIATFPEKSYGFLDLPVMDAEKIKKKLNGTILKGSKMRIEKARPEKKFEAESAEESEAPMKQKKGSKKRKRGLDSIPGAEIGDRSVKRGWTTPIATKSKDKEADKKKIKSKYTVGPECLFKTVVPPNVASTSKITEKPEKKKRGKPGKETVVHEFSKTTKYPTFLKSKSSGNTSVSAEFVEGKGWVDEEGNVVDEVVKTSKKDTKSNKPKKKRKEPTPEQVVEEESSSSEESSSGEESSAEAEPEIETVIAEPAVEEKDSTSEEDSSSGESSSEDEDEAQPVVPIVKTSILKAAPPSIPEAAEQQSDSSSSDSDTDSSDSTDSSSKDDAPNQDTIISPIESIDSRPVSRSSAPTNLSITIPPPTPITEIHPLEALYKRQKPNPNSNPETVANPAAESFSFFGTDDIEAEEAADQVPLTPYTQRDFEFRGMRSAAPTPDTAHASKRFVWPSSTEDDDYAEAPSSPIRGQGKEKKEVVGGNKVGEVVKGKGKEDESKGKAGEEESDFQKWFYEHRGEANRAWKKRRRVVAKEKRHRENRKRTERAI